MKKKNVVGAGVGYSPSVKVAQKMRGTLCFSGFFKNL